MKEAVSIKLRLDKVLADMGIAARRDIKRIIRDGRITVDGNIIRVPDYKLDPLSVSIKIDGMAAEYKKYRYIMLNKPSGYLSVTEDPHQQTVIDLLSGNYRRMGLFAAGRLDKDAEGFVLLTNDGQTAHKITSPSHHADKIYELLICGEVTSQDVEIFRNGVALEDGYICRPADLTVKSSGKESAVTVTLREGKYHQLKRMFIALNKRVLYIKRVGLAGIYLDPALNTGEYRELTAAEEQSLLLSTSAVTAKYSAL